MAKRAKEAAADPTHNMSTEEKDARRKELLEHLIANDNDLAAAQAKVKGVMGSRKALLKDLQKFDVSRDDALWYLSARKRDVEEIDRETRARNRIAKLMQLPIGAQLGLFEDGDSVAATVDKGDPEQMGHDAALAGKTTDDNPFEDGSPDFLKWTVGFNRGIEAGVKASIKAA